MTIYNLDVLPDLEPVCCFMSGSNCCFLTCIQISQEVRKVVWYSHLLKNFPQFAVTHTVKIAGRNINNLRFADDTTLMAESEEELNSLLMKVQEESEKVGIKLNTKITKMMASSPITSWQIDGETDRKSTRLNSSHRLTSRMPSSA